MRVSFSVTALCLLLSGAVAQQITSQAHTITFAEPIDGLSLGMPGDEVDLTVSGNVGGTWTDPQTLEIEKEFDPLLRESNLVLFEKPVTEVRIAGSTTGYDVHPIRISHEPTHVEVAARLPTPLPKILSRSQWGADEALLFAGNESSRSDSTEEKDSNGTEAATDASNPRVLDCEEAQKLYPQEFKVSRTERTDNGGKTYRWAHTYSPSVRLIAVHHTALAVGGDSRPAVERMRALYTYHANNRGWGDIGYHYVVDEKGQIYEGKSGGDYVVGGHAYCNNVGSIGIALMGNFDTEKPTQAQMHALQWLIIELARKYNIDLDQEITFHGKKTLPVVRHRDLVSTACPGYYVSNSITQIQSHVIAGNYNADVTFPSLLAKYTNRSDDRKAARLSKSGTTSTSSSELRAMGSTTITGRPGGEVRVSLTYRASTGLQRRARIANVSRSNLRIGLSQELDNSYLRVRDEILLPENLGAGKTTTIRLRIQLPTVAGTYTLDIGNVTYTLQAEGRRARVSAENIPQSLDPALLENTPTPGSRNVTGASSTSSSRSIPSVATNPTIRIRLGYTDNVARISADTAAHIGATALPKRAEVRLGREGDNCVALVEGQVIASGIVRFVPDNGLIMVESWKVPTNLFRGTLECRVVDGALALINELPLEEYLKGLSEEPDTEPYEKQRAFAIAARSYAAFYTDSANRKFPNKPYDGDDSAARFQKYSGARFERDNTAWVRAVESTSGIVVKKNGSVLKTPYFSSDDGRTKSPEDNGWKNFPFTEVFQSKPDPWCTGLSNAGHGVGMSGCGAKAQAREGKTAEEILKYYYLGIDLLPL